MRDRSRSLNVGLGVIPGFVGIKMLVSGVFRFPTSASLAVIGGVLTVTVVSLLRAERLESVGSP